jgi:hypothetical protein
MWVPVHDEEWEGDIFLGLTRPPSTRSNGTVTFKGNTLPWMVGKYEVHTLSQTLSARGALADASLCRSDTITMASIAC